MTSPLLDIRVEHPQTSLWVASSDPAVVVEAIGWGASGACPSLADVVADLAADAALLQARVERISGLYPGASASVIGRLLSEDLLLDVAAALQPTFEKHSGREGRVLLPTDPAHYRDADSLLENASELGALAANGLVAIPATDVGVRVMQEASRVGVSVAAVACCTLAQAIAAADAIEQGLARRDPNSPALGTIAPAVTFDIGLLSAHLEARVEAGGRLLDPAAADWAAIVVAKEVYRLFVERSYTARLIVVGLRVRPQFMELLGGDLVLAPSFDFQQRLQHGMPPARDRIGLPVARELVGDVVPMAEFGQVIEPFGVAPADFESFAPVRAALRQQLRDAAALSALAADLLYPAV